MLLCAGSTLHKITLPVHIVCWVRFVCLKRDVQLGVTYLIGTVSLFLGVLMCVFVLHFRCRTLSGSPRPKSFKKVHFIKNMRQHDMRNGRYEGKQRRPLVNTGLQWIMAGCPSQ